MGFQLNLHSETVRHAFLAEPLCVGPATSVRDILRLLKEHNRGSVLVCDPQQVLQGIFTERDSLRMMARGDGLDVAVETVMSRNPVTIRVHDTVETAIAKMSRGGYRHLPVIDDERRPVGVMLVSSILRYLVEHFPKFVYNLPPRPHHSTKEREGA